MPIFLTLLVLVLSVSADASQQNLMSIVKKTPWYEGVEIFGNLRYRHRYSRIKDESVRNVHDIRARFGASSQPLDELKVFFQVAGGTNHSPTAASQLLTESFSSKPLWVDMAYFQWTPMFQERPLGLTLAFGKMVNPIYKVGGMANEMIFDNELRPEGIAFRWASDGDQFDLRYNSSLLWAEERSSEADSFLVANQFGLNVHLARSDSFSASLLMGVEYHIYTSLAGRSTLYSPTSGFGNSVTTQPSGSTTYNNDFRLLTGFVELGMKTNGIPVAFFGQIVDNTAVENNSDDRAWIVGAIFGRIRTVTPVELAYHYRWVERDSTVGVMNRGGTNIRGHQFSASFNLGGPDFILMGRYRLEGVDITQSNNQQMGELMATAFF